MCIFLGHLYPGWSSCHLLSLCLQITSAADSEAVTYQKLVKGHAYSVTGAEEVRPLLARGCPGWGLQGGSCLARAALCWSPRQLQAFFYSLDQL
jgi:hypothetical protein